MTYTLHCFEEDCTHVMRVEADSEAAAIQNLVTLHDAHFKEADHPIDRTLTHKMKETMTQQFIQVR